MLNRFNLYNIVALEDQVGENEGVFVNRNGDVRSYISRGLHYGVIISTFMMTSIIPIVYLYKTITE